jgi:hypothetical protein
MPYENMVEYAKRCGVSKVTIFNHCKKGRIIRTTKGIDPGIPTNREYEEQAKLRQETGKITVKREPKPQEAKKKPAPRPKPPPGNDQGKNSAIVEIIEDGSLNGEPDEGFIHRHELERMKVAEQILKTRVETEQKRGELLDKKLTKRVMAKIFAVDTAELHPLGEKIAADIAAKFKSDDSQAILETRQIIDRHIFNALQHIKRLMNDYFDKIGEEGI